ncbi:glycosyltransferase family 2 protein [uncultured Tenacibaculum sp.]|uniref:glycosyltransferase family 2 protein n=1 Tax=uncultured Tenacibaculum sp. TaxID=174713 RepID=UPI002617C53C|nr:glycosyltransferase family 2 protein [uncultured Tenacibaculum sp.]
MKFSVVIPLYNKAPYIQETLHSLAIQTQLPYEIIIVDDKSTDGSLEKVRAYIQTAPTRFQNVRIEIVELDKNYGIGYTRNIGYSKTTGDIVSFLDSDDIYEDGIIEKASGMMLRHNIDFLIVGIQLFPSKEIYPNIQKIQEELTLVDSETFLLNNPLRTITSHNFYMGVGSNVLIKRECGSTIKFIEKKIFYEGIDYWYRVLRNHINKGNKNIGLLIGEYLRIREVPGSESRKKYSKWNQIDVPPVLTRFKKSKDYYDKRLKGVVAYRWIKHALASLNSSQQKLKFIWVYRSVFFRQCHYYFLHKF